LNSLAASLYRLEETSTVSCSDLNDLLNSEKAIVVDGCSNEKLLLFSEELKKTSAFKKLCRYAPLSKAEPFYTQSKDVLKCRLGYKRACYLPNPQPPKDLPGF
jgi:hypothetical protein